MMKGFIERLRYSERRFKRTFHYGEKGFTLMELLIVIAVLGILAAVLVPRMGSFLSSGQAAAANTEVANVESAALAYYADNDGTWPTSDEDLSGYLSDDPVGTYQFDDYGKVGGTSGVPATGDTWGSGGEAHDDVVWNDGDHEWKKSS
jgi:prepilin-type N-terminal cleavage/methylation domain-containing protein